MTMDQDDYESNSHADLSEADREVESDRSDAAIEDAVGGAQRMSEACESAMLALDDIRSMAKLLGHAIEMMNDSPLLTAQTTAISDAIHLFADMAEEQVRTMEGAA